MIIKITGFILLALGLVIILGSLYSSYNIFTGTTEIPQIFNFSQQITNTSLDQNSDLQQQLNNIIGDKINNMIPQDILPNLLNLVSWSIFMGLAIFAGSQISSLGIKLIK